MKPNRYGFGWAKPKAEVRKTKKNFPTKLFQRVDATVQPSETPGNENLVNARVLLNDLSPSGVSLFLDRELGKGSQVNMVINGSQYIFLRGKILWCTLHTYNTKVISAHRYEYRARVIFEFDSVEDRTQLTNYCKELRTIDSGPSIRLARGALALEAPVAEKKAVYQPSLTEDQEIDQLFEKLKRMTEAL